MAEDRKRDQHAKDLAWAQRHGAFEDDVGRALAFRWSLGGMPPHLQTLIDRRVQRMRTDEIFGRLNPFPPPRLTRGDIVAGKAPNGARVWHRCNDLTSNGLIVGNTGATKTTFLIFLVLQFLKRGVRAFLADMHKRQLRHLLPFAKKLGRPMVVLRPKRFRFNLLQAGRLDPLAHLAIAVDLLVRILGLPDRATTILRQTCHGLYREFGVFDGRGVWPTLYDVWQRIKAGTGLNASARDAILDRLASLLLSLGPESAAYRVGWDPIDLSQFSVVFEMRGASEGVKQLQLVPTLYSIFVDRVQEDAPNRPLDLFMAFEDAQRFFDTGAHLGAGISPLEELVGVSRSTGLSLWVIVQTMEGVSRRLSANLATKYFGRLGDAEDYRRLAGDLGLSAEQLNWAKKHLGPGHFVGQAATGSWREPYMLEVPRIDLPPVVTDEDVAASERLLDPLPTRRADEYWDWDPYRPIDVQPDVPSLALPVGERRLLAAVAAQPGLATGEYRRLLRINGTKIARYRSRLVERAYIREHEISRRSSGKPAIVLEPLPAGIEALGEES